jgi:hypothetical protein
MEMGNQRPDPWQVKASFHILTAAENTILNASRGAGKTAVVAANALLEVTLFGGYVLIISGSERQSKRVKRYIREYHEYWNLIPVISQTTEEMLFANGGRVLAVPSKSATVVGEHGVTMLVIDEASIVADEVYARMTPTTVTCNGRIILLSTPYGKRGFFYKESTGKGREWGKVFTVPWTECPRITLDIVNEDRKSHGEQWVRQEYGCVFLDVTTAPMDVEAVRRLVNPGLRAYTGW